MSMKRSKQFGSGRRMDDFVELPSINLDKPLADPDKSWDDHMAGKPEDAFIPYSLKSHFTQGALIVHSKFGKGVVLRVEGPHIDVLFAEGKKKLSHAKG